MEGGGNERASAEVVQARRHPRRVEIGLLLALAALALGSYDATESPVWRTTPTAGGGCSCGQPGAPGAPGTPSGISARRLDVHSDLTDSPTWRTAYPQYYHPRTVLPLGATRGIDLRHVYPFPVIANAAPMSSLSEAAKTGQYRVSWRGDASSLLVAFQMPTARDGTEWDFSDRGGRITPDLQELEGNLYVPPYGEYLQFVWSSVLKSNGTTDQIEPTAASGTLDPVTLAGLSETPACKDFYGHVVRHGHTYGDVTPDYYHAVANTYGYFRQYDPGSCSSFLGLERFVSNGLTQAGAELTAPGQFPTGDIHIRTQRVHLLMASVLRDQAGQGPVLRVPGQDEVQADLTASGVAATTVFGDYVTCPFYVTWKVRLRLDVHADRPYYNRIQLHVVDISKPDIHLDSCSGYANLFNIATNALLDAFTMYRFDYQTIAEGKVNAQTATVKANLVGSLTADVNKANEALAPPLPATALVVPNPLVAAAAGAPAYRQEIQAQRATSTLLLSRAPGPAGSCINKNLKDLDNSYCGVPTDATLRALRRQPGTAEFGRAVARLIRSDPSMFTCGPIRGARGYSGQLAARALVPSSKDASGNTMSLANHIGSCVHSGDVPRLFVIGDQIVQACLDPSAPNIDCRLCAQTQDNGNHCNLFSLLASDNHQGLFGRKCLRPVQYQSSAHFGPVYPQVFCASAAGGRCLPRFKPYAGLLGDETAAMCVPVNPTCAPCWDLLDPGQAVHDPANLKACLDAPAFCRVPRGLVNPQSCDARGFAPLIDEGLIRIPTPYRCRLELPLSRIDLQPDGYRVVLANGFRCRSPSDCRPCPPGQPCNVNSLGDSELKYLVWDQLTNVLGGDLGVPEDISAPSCYPGRDELGGRSQMGTSALLGQLKNGQTLINPAGCGWQ